MTEMGETNERLDADELLIDQIELASEIVRSSQAAVAFQRAFYLEILTFDRVHKEIEDFNEKVKKLKGKLDALRTDLEQVENVSGASRAAVLGEKLETLMDSSKEFQKKTTETKRMREPMYNELNSMILRELNKAKVTSVASNNFKDVHPPNLTLFVNDNEFHLIESISDEWTKLRKKLENYLQKYVEDTVSLRVEVFGATYMTSTADTNSQNNSVHVEENGRGLMQKLSGLILQKKTSGSQLTVNSISGPLISNGNSKPSSRTPSCRDTSFFYCSDSDTQSQEDKDRDKSGCDGEGTNMHSGSALEITHSL